MRRFDPDVCLDYVTDYGLTFLIGAPTNLVMLADAQEKRPRDLSSLRGIVTMGAPLERQACLRFQRVLTPRIFNGYGTPRPSGTRSCARRTCLSTPDRPGAPAPTTTSRWCGPPMTAWPSSRATARRSAR